MSQQADIEDIVKAQPLPREQQAQLFFELMQALSWEVDGVYNPQDAEVYLFGMSR